MARWYVCTMDDGVLSKHPTKREAVQAVLGHLEWPIPRRLRPGEYEYSGDWAATRTTTYYVMDERGARRNGWEPT